MLLVFSFPCLFGILIAVKEVVFLEGDPVYSIWPLITSICLAFMVYVSFSALVLLGIILVLGTGIAAFWLNKIWWCGVCGKRNKAKAKFCCGCGKPHPMTRSRVRSVAVMASATPQLVAAMQANWFCTERGTSNFPEAVFCENCGKSNPFLQ